MDTSTIIQTIHHTLAQEFELNEEQLIPEADLNKDLGLDSLDAVDMVVVLEQAFKIKIRAQYAPGQIRTLGDLYAFVEKLKNQPREPQVVDATETSAQAPVEAFADSAAS